MRHEKPRLPCSTLPIQCRYCTGSDRSSHSSARICASTCGSPRSSPAITSAGIARHQLLQAEHQDADQHQRRDDLRDARAEMSAHYFAISRPWMRIMPSGTARKPFSFAVMRDDVAGIPQIGERQILAQARPHLRIQIAPLGRIGHARAPARAACRPPCCVAPVVVGLTAVQELIGIAVDIDTAGPADHVGLIVAANSRLQRRGEFHRLDVHVEAGLGSPSTAPPRPPACSPDRSIVSRSSLTGSVTPACLQQRLRLRHVACRHLQRFVIERRAGRHRPARSARTCR